MCFDFCIALLVGIPVGITTSALWLKICALTPGNEKYKLIIKRKRKNHNNMLSSNCAIGGKKNQGSLKIKKLVD